MSKKSFVGCLWMLLHTAKRELRVSLIHLLISLWKKKKKKNNNFQHLNEEREPPTAAWESRNFNDVDDIRNKVEREKNRAQWRKQQKKNELYLNFCVLAMSRSQQQKFSIFIPVQNERKREKSKGKIQMRRDKKFSIEMKSHFWFNVSFFSLNSFEWEKFSTRQYYIFEWKLHRFKLFFQSFEFLLWIFFLSSTYSTFNDEEELNFKKNLKSLPLFTRLLVCSFIFYQYYMWIFFVSFYHR